MAIQKNGWKKIAQKIYALIRFDQSKRANYLKRSNSNLCIERKFSDPRKVEGVELTENPIPNIENIMKTTRVGKCSQMVMVAELQIWNFKHLRDYHSIICLRQYQYYTQKFCPKIHMVPSISNAYKSKDKIAVHLAEKSNYSRDIVYSRLDFKDFITINSKGIKYRKEGISPSDESTYNIVLDN